MAKNDTSAPGDSKVNMTMQPTEFAELRALAADIRLQDHRLGQFLMQLVEHLGHAHGLDAATEDEKARMAEETAAEQQKTDEQPAQKEVKYGD